MLLYLIRKEEMDIFDIEIHKITAQYLEYMKLMKELDLELAGDFIAMASTLLQIKSRMLLPQYNENGEVVESEDPRKELVQRLLEYQKYQEAGKALYERPLLGRDIWARGMRERLETKEEEIVLEENALFSLISAYRLALRSIKNKFHQVTAKTQSIASRILQIKDRLFMGQKVALSSLLDVVEDQRRQLLITFLSILELGKMGFVSVYQSEVYSEIWIEARKPIETDALSRVEEYESVSAEAAAANMIEKSEKMQEEFLMDAGDEDFIIPEEQPEAATGLAVDDGAEIASDEDIAAAEAELSAAESTSPSPIFAAEQAGMTGNAESDLIEEFNPEVELT